MISDCTLTNIMTYLCKNILGYLYFESSSDNPRFINTIFFVATHLINEYWRWINVEKFDYLVFATFWSFYKFLATLTLQQLLDFWNFLQHFFATFLLQKSRSLQHYLMLQGKMSMLQKKNLWHDSRSDSSIFTLKALFLIFFFPFSFPVLCVF